MFGEPLKRRTGPERKDGGRGLGGVSSSATAAARRRASNFEMVRVGQGGGRELLRGATKRQRERAGWRLLEGQPQLGGWGGQGVMVGLPVGMAEKEVGLAIEVGRAVVNRV